MDTLNEGAHVSFRALMAWVGLRKNPHYLPADLRDKYCIGSMYFTPIRLWYYDDALA